MLLGVIVFSWSVMWLVARWPFFVPTSGTVSTSYLHQC